MISVDQCVELICFFFFPFAVKLNEKDEDSPTELNYEVVFDEEFLGGLKMR